MIAPMTPATTDRAYRGSDVDFPRGVPLPSERLLLFRAGQLRKRWHYVYYLESGVVFLRDARERGAVAKGILGRLGSRVAAVPAARTASLTACDSNRTAYTCATATRRST